MTVSALFLDIDGVLNHHRFILWRGQHAKPPYALHQRLDPAAVKRLAHLLETLRMDGVDVVCVLSSTWRLHPDRGRQRTEAALQVHAPTLTLFDETPDLEPELGPELPRGREIERWLAAHPEIESFAILDDHDDLAPYEAHLVQIDRAVGLTDDDCDRAAALLR